MSHENYDPYFPDQPVVDLYLPVWAKLPAFQSKPAFIWVEDGSPGAREPLTLTYGQLNDSVQFISSQLLLQLNRGDTIVTLCSSGLEFVEVIFACQRAGLLSVPIVPPNPSFSKNDHHHLVRVLSQTKPKAAIASSGYIKHVQSYIREFPNTQVSELLQKPTWISVENIRKRNINDTMQIGWWPYNGCKQNEEYLIQYTSGGSGIPKPVLLTAGSAAHNVRTARKSYDLHPNSVIVSWLPQYHDCGLMFLLLTVVSGATSVLTSPDAFIRRPRLWLELMTEFKATCTPVPSFTLPLVVKRGEADKGSIPINLSSIKNLIIINEPIYNDAVEEFVQVFKPLGLNPLAISPSYGLAENCTFVSTAWRDSQRIQTKSWSSSLPSHSKFSFPVYNKLLPSARLGFRGRYDDDDGEDIDIIVVNEETHELVEDGVEGEIWIHSPSNASGYLGHPSLTREVFQGKLSNRVSQNYVRTGDRGIVKGEERYLFVTGRCSDIIKLQNGAEFHPHYLETAAYNSYPHILRAGCLAAFMVSRTVIIGAEMQRSEKETRVLREICEGIRKNVSKDEEIEVGLVALVKSRNIPKTTSGKVQRWAAKDKFLRGELNVVMQMKFGLSDYGSISLGTITGSSEGKEKTMVASEETEATFHSTSNSHIYPAFLSSL